MLIGMSNFEYLIIRHKLMANVKSILAQAENFYREAAKIGITPEYHFDSPSENDSFKPLDLTDTDPFADLPAPPASGITLKDKPSSGILPAIKQTKMNSYRQVLQAVLDDVIRLTTNFIVELSGFKQKGPAQKTAMNMRNNCKSLLRLLQECKNLLAHDGTEKSVYGDLSAEIDDILTNLLVDSALGIEFPMYNKMTNRVGNLTAMLDNYTAAGYSKNKEKSMFDAEDDDELAGTLV